jgi:ssDNA thymidine ADP-ribosyltransferase, DarT
MPIELNAQNAWVFRIVHVRNLPWILDNGLHCRNSSAADPNFVQIGNADLIDRRQYRPIAGPYNGTLGDYIPFYFTPLSPMFYNIKTGWNGIQQRSNQEIAILVGSLHDLKRVGRPFVFTDRHAYLQTAQVFDDLSHLDKVDWSILQRRDFKRDPENPEKVERYEAEALMHMHPPFDALCEVACCDAQSATALQLELTKRDIALKVTSKPGWYF